MADFIPVEVTDTFDQWRIKTNQLGADFALIEDSLEGAISNIDLSSKSDTNHDHVIADVTDLQSGLDALVAAIAANGDAIDGKVSLTGNENIFGNKTFSNSLTAGNSFTATKGVSIIGVENDDKLSIKTGKMKLRDQDYTWPADYTAGRYLRTDQDGNLTWEEVAGGSGSVNLSTLVFNDIVPVGTIMPWAGTALPSGGKWAFCSGQSVSSITYEELAGVIGIKYGPRGNNTVTLPNLNGKVPVGGSGSVVGDEGGKTLQPFSGSGGVTGSVTISGSTAGHKLTSDQTGVKSHSHEHIRSTMGVTLKSSGGVFAATVPNVTVGNDVLVGRVSDGNNYGIESTNVSADQDATEEHSHGAGTLSGTLSGALASVTGSVDVMQPYLVTQYIIKVLPDDVQQVSITAGPGINVKGADGFDGNKIDLFSTELNVKVDPEHFTFTTSGLLQLKVFPAAGLPGEDGQPGQPGQPGTSVTASVSNGILTITSA